MLAELTHERFAAHLNQTFRLTAGTDTLEFELIDVEPRGADDAAYPGRRPFSLLFRGPMTPILPQQIYRFEHDGLGGLDLFAVPVGPDDIGMRYEVIFN